jgi:hypothetical protein
MLLSHRQQLDALRAVLQVEPLFDERKHDDIFLLRFLLSYEPRGRDVSAAASAVRRSLSVRQIHKLDELGEMVERTPIRRWLDGPLREQLADSMDIHLVHADPDGPLLVCTRLSDCDFGELMSKVGSANYVRASMMLMEFVSRRMDAATRRKGRLVKYIRVIDCAGFTSSSLIKAIRFLRMDAAKIHDLQVLYPQMLGNVLFLHAPTTITVIYDRFIRPVIPSRVSQKTLVLCPRKFKAHARLLERLISPMHVHTSYGGALETYYQPDPSERDAHVAHIKAAVMNEARRRGWPKGDKQRASITAAEMAEAAIANGNGDRHASEQFAEGGELHRSIMRRIFEVSR